LTRVSMGVKSACRKTARGSWQRRQTEVCD